jgi:hypothetical protein
MSLKSMAIAVSLIVAATATTSFAEHRRCYPGESACRMGYSRGYQDGLGRGADEGRDHEGYDYRHEKAYRCADAGYRDWYGSRYEYSSGYRSGFEIGYRQAYSRYAGARCTRRYDRAYENGHSYGRQYDDRRQQHEEEYEQQ